MVGVYWRGCMLANNGRWCRWLSVCNDAKIGQLEGSRSQKLVVALVSRLALVDEVLGEEYLGGLGWLRSDF